MLWIHASYPGRKPWQTRIKQKTMNKIENKIMLGTRKHISENKS